MAIIGTILLIFFIYVIYSGLSHNKKVQNSHIYRGGLHKSFPKLVSILENHYQMNFFIDTGNKFMYVKQENPYNNIGDKVFIGVKLDLKNDPVLFSEIILANGNKIKGLDVMNFDNSDEFSINLAINMSLREIEKYI